MPEAIDLSEATLAVGTGTTVLGLDDTLLTLLLAQAPSLMPTSEAPNVALSAPHIVLGNVALDGDYVFLQTSLLETSGAFSTPTNDISELFVHLLPYKANQDMGLDISRTDERRLGQEGVSAWRTRWPQSH